MRRPKPWFWKARMGWYVELHGKQIKLGTVDAKTKYPPDEVMREFHRLMAGEGLLTDKERQQATVPVVVESFIESKSATRQKTVQTYVFYLEPFAIQNRTKKLESIKANDVLKFVAGQTTWGDSTKHNAIMAVKGLFRWARDNGFMDANPVAGLMNPYPIGRRERGISLEEFQAMIETAKDDAFRTFLRMLRDTGCRPGELCSLSARHLVKGQPLAKLAPKEHKTGGRTGKPKFIILPRPIAEELRELAKERPNGALLLNTQGRAWTVDTIEKRVKRLREKLGFDTHVVPYAARHTFLTRLIELGTPLAIAAKIAGHSRTDTIMDAYLHPEMDAMVEAVNGASLAQSPKAETAEEKIARLEAELAALRDKN